MTAIFLPFVFHLMMLFHFTPSSQPICSASTVVLDVNSWNLANSWNLMWGNEQSLPLSLPNCVHDKIMMIIILEPDSVRQAEWGIELTESSARYLNYRAVQPELSRAANAPNPHGRNILTVRALQSQNQLSGVVGSSSWWS